ncbi:MULTISPECIES: hypothetical protein [unclassified Streptomyces]|uniref:hypothetical protein n=1 Tax=unclassified Streptomyces TaxID=2593676 RepID=UPI002E3031DC|nr:MULTISPECIES: hypothetical protein [unclassified Streptomyces]
MHTDDQIAQAVDKGLPDDQAARIQADIARVQELAYYGFKGRVYEVFQDELLLETESILKGMIRDGSLGRLAMERFNERGITFWIHPEDLAALRADAAARDEILIDMQVSALKKFRTNALINKEWNPNHKGPRGASCLRSYFIGTCIWEFRRAYLSWAQARVKWAELHALRDFAEEAPGGGGGILSLLQAPGYLAEPEAIVLTNNFEDILAEQTPQTQAVISLTVHGLTDTEIADTMKITNGAVRTCKTRFRKTLYQAARERRIWIPAQLHTTAKTPHDKQQAGAA